jgi:replicative DNA helicase
MTSLIVFSESADEVKNMVICRVKHRNESTGKAQLACIEQYAKFSSLARCS